MGCIQCAGCLLTSVKITIPFNVHHAQERIVFSDLNHAYEISVRNQPNLRERPFGRDDTNLFKKDTFT